MELHRQLHSITHHYITQITILSAITETTALILSRPQHYTNNASNPKALHMAFLISALRRYRDRPSYYHTNYHTTPYRITPTHPPTLRQHRNVVHSETYKHINAEHHGGFRTPVWHADPAASDSTDVKGLATQPQS